MSDYWLPPWWDWMQDWSGCVACTKRNHTPCASCEIPPGLLGLVCLVGGGTAAVAGTMRGNVGIENAQQARAASRVSGSEAVNRQIERRRDITLNIENADIGGALRRQAKKKRRRR